MGVLGCTYTYNVNLRLKQFTNYLCLCSLCLQVIINQRFSAKPVKYNFVLHTGNITFETVGAAILHYPTYTGTSVSVLAGLIQI